MKINPKQKIKEIDGKESELTIGQAIANILLSHQSGGKMKMFVLADKFYNGDKDIELDTADLAIVKQAIETTSVYNNLVSGQLCVLLEGLKD